MTLPTIDGMHHVGCHCNDICACSDPIECIHEQCICDRLSVAYRRGREDAAEAVKDLIRQQLGYGKAEWIDDDDYEFIAAARGDALRREAKASTALDGQTIAIIPREDGEQA